MVTEPGPSCILVKHLSHVQGAIKRGTGMQVAPMSFVAWGHQAQIILQPILGAWGPGLPWCDHHHLWQGAPGSHHCIRAAHLLPPGHWGHYLVLIEFWGLTSPSHFPLCWSREQPYQLYRTPSLTCIFRGIPLTCSFLVLLAPSPFWGATS